MAEYTPTTEEIREYVAAADRVTAHMFSPEEADAVEAFDRWLAAHDAEVRAGVVPEIGMPCANQMPHPAHAWQMSATGWCLCAGVAAEEPEWEYRAVAWELDTENVYDSTRPALSAGEAIDIAAAQRLLDSNADMPALVIGVQRRRKAGPWVPVKQEVEDA